MVNGKNHPKNQHYVPQFILRNFAEGKKRRTHVFDKLHEKQFVSHPKNIAAESGFYDFEVDGTLHSLEQFMGAWETRASRIIKSIIKEESLAHLTTEDRKSLSLFAALQKLRVKSVRDGLKSLNVAVRDALAARGADPGNIVPEMSDEAIKETSLAQIGMAEKFAKHFHTKGWLLQRAPKGNPFYTSDSPITLHNSFEQERRGNLGLASLGVVIYFPISSRLSICCLCPTICQAIQHGLRTAAGESRRFGYSRVDVSDLERVATAISTGQPDPLLPENVRHQNSLQVAYSSRFVYSATDDFSLAKTMIRGNPDLKHPVEIIAQ